MMEQEARTGQVNLPEQNSEAIEVILKYIYGGGQYIKSPKSWALLKLYQAAALDIVEETANKPVIQFCVDLYRAADFLLLNSMFPMIQRRLGDHCDEKLKWLCTRGVMQIDKPDQTVLLWTKDLVGGIEEAYRWKAGLIKTTLMEFVWVGRRKLLSPTWIGIQDDLDSTPAFMKDMIRHCALYGWQKEAIWAPKASKVASSKRWSCARCNKPVVKWQNDNSDAFGQVWDPFTLTGENRISREWCKECSAMDMIPWREIKP